MSRPPSPTGGYCREGTPRCRTTRLSAGRPVHGAGGWRSGTRRRPDRRRAQQRRQGLVRPVLHAVPWPRRRSGRCRLSHHQAARRPADVRAASRWEVPGFRLARRDRGQTAGQCARGGVGKDRRVAGGQGAGRGGRPRRGGIDRALRPLHTDEVGRGRRRHPPDHAASTVAPASRFLQDPFAILRGPIVAGPSPSSLAPARCTRPLREPKGGANASGRDEASGFRGRRSARSGRSAPRSDSPQGLGPEAQQGQQGALRCGQHLHRVQLDGPGAGIQVALDAEAWKSLRIASPDGRSILAVGGKGSLKKLGLSEFFFESDEPGLDELPLNNFLAMFPEGEYKFFGTTPDGEKLLSTATFSHQIPDGPVVVSPALQDRANAVIRWNPVTAPAGIAIASYEVVIEQEDRTFDVTLPATATSVTIPPEFLQPATAYPFEVLAKAENGNQTITGSSFSTM